MRSRQAGFASVRKALLLRVGIDSGCGGTLGPIFADDTFEYVLIPERPEHQSPRSLFYDQLPARHGGTLAQYVPPRYRRGAAHYDPEFETFTYGDPTRNKRRQLLRLDEGDLLLFYAGLRPLESREPARLYLIGYFTIAAVECVEPGDIWPAPEYEHLLGNAHLRRKSPDPDLVVVRGDPSRSALFERAIPISDEKQWVTPEVAEVLGIQGSLMRAIGRWVSPDRMSGARRWLQGHQTVRTLIYKRTHSGDPDPETGVFGNHDCMGCVRSRSYDAVIGVGGCSPEPMRNGIARKLTWVGIGPHKVGDARCPQVTFDHFLYYGEEGPALEELAPELARHLYEGRARWLISGLSAMERSEVQRILDLARDAPPSGHGAGANTSPAIRSAASACSAATACDGREPEAL